MLETVVGVVGLIGAGYGFVKWGLPWVRRRLNRPAPQDIRVRVTGGSIVALHPDGPVEEDKVFVIRVENHSDRDFFLQGIAVEDGDDPPNGATMQIDLEGKPNTGGVVQAGDAYKFTLPVRILVGRSYEYAVATDKLGRKFRSPKGMLVEETKELLDLTKSAGS